MTRASDVGTEFSRGGVDVDGDEGDGGVWVCEARVVDGEDVGGEDRGVFATFSAWHRALYVISREDDS